MLVEHAGEGAQQRRFRRGAFLPIASLVVDVEQDGFGGNIARTLHLRAHHRVGNLVLKVLIRGAPAHFPIRQQIAEHFQKVRLAAAEEAADPYADTVGRRINCLGIAFEERGEVPLQFARDDVFGQLLLNRRLVVLGNLHDAVDGTVDVLGKQVFDNHGIPLTEDRTLDSNCRLSGY